MSQRVWYAAANRRRLFQHILQKNQDGFYGVVHSKKYGVPINPDCRHFISTQPDQFRQFVKWIRNWNSSYSPKAIAKYNELMTNILNLKK